MIISACLLKIHQSINHNLSFDKRMNLYLNNLNNFASTLLKDTVVPSFDVIFSVIFSNSGEKIL